jgi:hypothetical protein
MEHYKLKFAATKKIALEDLKNIILYSCVFTLSIIVTLLLYSTYKYDTIKSTSLICIVSAIVLIIMSIYLINKEIVDEISNIIKYIILISIALFIGTLLVRTIYLYKMRFTNNNYQYMLTINILIMIIIIMSLLITYSYIKSKYQ